MGSDQTAVGNWVFARNRNKSDANGRQYDYHGDGPLSFMPALSVKLSVKALTELRTAPAG